MRKFRFVDDPDNEKWDWVPKYIGHYQVSTKGRVKSFKKMEFIMKVFSKEGRYNSVTFHIDNKPKTEMIHQIMAETFLGHIPASRKFVVDHIDGNKQNNVIDNLQIISARENTSKDKKGFTSVFSGICLDSKSGKMQSAIRLDGKKYYIGKYLSEHEAKEKYEQVLVKYKELGLNEALKLIMSFRVYKAKELIKQLDEEQDANATR